MILSVVLPFYDEEAALPSVLRRACEAAQALRSGRPGLDEVELIVVDDGSRDGGAAMAEGVPGVRLLRHPENRGYGAALKTGFAAAKGDWLAFLDADGTCDPASLGGLLDKAVAEDLDVVIGARLHDGSRMPALRAAGNRLFRALTRLCGGRPVTDVASGIRVVRRAAYERMAPLPDGMDFTPAMSARALLDPALSLGELPVPYDERVGRSKLSPVGDGLRFARVILETGLVYRPRAVFGWAAAALAALAAVLYALRLGGPASPLATLLAGRPAEPWMFFRFVLIAVCVSLAAFLTALGIVAQALVGVVHRDRAGALAGASDARGAAALLARAGAACFALGVAVNARPLASYLETGHIAQDYWTLPIVGGVLSAVGVQLVGFWAAARIAALLLEREALRDGRGGKLIA